MPHAELWVPARGAFVFRMRDSKGVLWTFTVSGEQLQALDPSLKSIPGDAFEKHRPAIARAARRRQELESDPTVQHVLTDDDLRE